VYNSYACVSVFFRDVSSGDRGLGLEVCWSGQIAVISCLCSDCSWTSVLAVDFTAKFLAVILEVRWKPLDSAVGSNAWFRPRDSSHGLQLCRF